MATNIPAASPGVENMDAMIWRYMDLAKFVALLDTRALYFCRADRLDDSFEGFVPTIEQTKRVAPQAIPDKHLLIFRAASLEHRKRIFVNCWHRNDIESAAMWKLYLRTGDGIAIQSTPRKLQRAASQSKLLLGDVEYLNFDQLAWSNPASSVRPFFQKRKSFEHEREFRAVRSISIDEPIVPELDVSSDLETLIDRVVLAPGTPSWQANAICSLVSRYQLNKPVEESSLDAQADWSEVEHMTVKFGEPIVSKHQTGGRPKSGNARLMTADDDHIEPPTQTK
jgi:hypothetical protein